MGDNEGILVLLLAVFSIFASTTGCLSDEDCGEMSWKRCCRSKCLDIAKWNECWAVTPVTQTPRINSNSMETYSTNGYRTFHQTEPYRKYDHTGTLDHTDSYGTFDDTETYDITYDSEDYSSAIFLSNSSYLFLLIFIIPVILGMCYCTIINKCNARLEAGSRNQTPNNTEAAETREGGEESNSFSPILYDEPPSYEDACPCVATPPPPRYHEIIDDFPLPRYKDVVVNIGSTALSSNDRV